VVADAKPVMVCVVARTCLMSKKAVEFAAIVAAGINTTLLRAMVNVADEPAVLVTATFVTIVVVDDGTV
jgi:hypothetical protein